MTELLPGWVASTLGDIGLYLNGRGFKKSEWRDHGRPIIRIQNLTGSSDSFNYYEGEAEDRHVVRKGDLLISWAATLGVYVWNGPEAVLNQHIFKVKSFIDPAFHRYLVESVLNELLAQTHGSGMVHITKIKFEATPVLIPPLAEQRRIVNAIEEHFTRIDAAERQALRARQQLPLLERVVTELLLTGETGMAVPNGASGTELLDLAETIRRDELDGSGFRLAYSPSSPEIASLPPLPDGWVWGTIGQVVVRVTVGHVGRIADRYVDEGVPLLRSQNVRANQFDPDGLQFIDEEFHDELGKSAIDPGDVLVVRSGDVGTACVMPDTIGPANCADIVLVKRPVAVDPRWLSYYMNSLASGAIRAGQVGVALQHFNTKSVAALPVPVAPMEVQQRVADELDSLRSKLQSVDAACSTSARRAAQLRTTVLAAAFAGRLLPQDPDDEPAQVLLDRIAEERAVQKPGAKKTKEKLAS